MKALVLGGSGFIGSHVVDRLLASGVDVRVFDRQPERHRAPVPGVDYRFGSFDDPFAVAEAVDGVDLVYHLICTTVPSTSNLDPAADVQSNLVSSVRLFECMAERGPKRIVFLSSGGTVYGNPTSSPVVEDHPLQPISSYGVLKVTIERYLFMYQHLHGLEPLVLRPSNPFGPRQGHVGVQGLVPTFLARARAGEPLVVFGDGSIVRDYLYIDDLASLCVGAGLSRETGIFNVGSGRGHSILDIVEFVRAATELDPVVQHVDARDFDVREIVLDVSRARAAFDWSPSVDIEDGIRAHWAWLQSAGDAG